MQGSSPSLKSGQIPHDLLGVLYAATEIKVISISPSWKSVNFLHAVPFLVYTIFNIFCLIETCENSTKDVFIRSAFPATRHKGLSWVRNINIRIHPSVHLSVISTAHPLRVSGKLEMGYTLGKSQTFHKAYHRDKQPHTHTPIGEPGVLICMSLD